MAQNYIHGRGSAVSNPIVCPIRIQICAIHILLSRGSRRFNHTYFGVNGEFSNGGIWQTIYDELAKQIVIFLKMRYNQILWL